MTVRRFSGGLFRCYGRVVGMLAVVDSSGRKWTLYSSDADCTAMFTPATHTLNLEFAVLVEKFPAGTADGASADHRHNL